jgi:hypothetical protein
LERAKGIPKERVLEGASGKAVSHLDVVFHSLKNFQFDFDRFDSYSSSGREYHALSRDHAIVGCGGIIVEDDGCELHYADNVVGGSLHEYTTDCHPAVDASELVGRY